MEPEPQKIHAKPGRMSLFLVVDSQQTMAAFSLQLQIVCLDNLFSSVELPMPIAESHASSFLFCDG